MRWVLDHFGLARPYRFERTLLALVAVIVLLATGVLALVLWHAGELRSGTLRATYLYYLVGLALVALISLRWTKLGMALVALAAIELGLGIATRLLPDNISDPQRFAWHVLLQAVPIPSLDMVSSNGVHIHHTSQGTRGREPTERELADRTVIAAFGGSSTYDVALSDGETWTDGCSRRWATASW